jgi:hypothetical protein
VLSLLKSWIEGEPFYSLAKPLQDADTRVSGDRVTSGHIVAICEGGFGFDLAMIVASMVDLVEPLDGELSAQIAKLQRQIKYGLKEDAAIAFYEYGFADRVVAQTLGRAFDGLTDRADVRRVCRRQFEEVLAVLNDFPAYFLAVAHELRGA